MHDQVFLYKSASFSVLCIILEQKVRVFRCHIFFNQICAHCVIQKQNEHYRVLIISELIKIRFFFLSVFISQMNRKNQSPKSGFGFWALDSSGHISHTYCGTCLRWSNGSFHAQCTFDVWWMAGGRERSSPPAQSFWKRERVSLYSTWAHWEHPIKKNVKHVFLFLT